MSSPLGAVQDATPAPGSFPLVVHVHGSPGAGADSQRVMQLPLHEMMASHGFVTVVALNSASPVNRVRDISRVIDIMLARSADAHDTLSGSIDPARIGVSGVSAGGGAAISAAVGWSANDLAADPRITAMALYEPASAFYSLEDAGTMTIPYLVMSGAQSSTGESVPALFDGTLVSEQRIHVLSPDATHFNYLTGMGLVIDAAREAALLADPSLPEPLTTAPTSALAAEAYNLWNMGEAVYAVLGPGAGGGRNFCTRVGVNSARSLDTSPRDGVTDSRPFRAIDPPYLVRPAIPEPVMVGLIQHYTIAFWKAFLGGDRRYMRYLTPGFAARSGFESVVEIE